VLVVDPRFNGPPGSGNGGYVCGLVAEAAGFEAVEVTLRTPPPLATPLEVTQLDGVVLVRAGEQLVAEARQVGPPGLAPPFVPSFAEARALAATYLGFRTHAFPTCFVCGPQHPDGLRIHPGWGGEGVAAPWTPAADLDDGSGAVATPFVWAALDCAGAWATAFAPANSDNGNVPEDGGPVGDGSTTGPAGVEGAAVLGRLTADLRRPVPVGADLVVVGWGLGEDGRKLFAGTAVCDPEGEPYAVAAATWIRLAS
jgi:hypothetical protein